MPDSRQRGGGPPLSKRDTTRRVRNDLTLYDRHGDAWWDPDARAFASLRRVNAFRFGLLESWCGSWLRGARVVDLGCGGGLLAEPLAARGAHVLGIDTSLPSLRCAAARHRPRCRYVRGDLLSAPVRSDWADLVLLADVLEHVDDPRAAVAEAARIVAPGGHLYVNTINRTRRARWLAVHLAEGVGLVPRGTHDADMFVTPDELSDYARGAGLTQVSVAGEAPDLWATVRHRAITLRHSRSLAVGYGALFAKKDG